MRSILLAITTLLFAPCTFAISPDEAAKHIGEIVTVAGNAVCVDFVYKSICFGYSERVEAYKHLVKKVVFRAVVRDAAINNRDLSAYLNGPISITGRVYFDEADPNPWRVKDNSWAYWEGGPQIVILNKWQIKHMEHPPKAPPRLLRK